LFFFGIVSSVDEVSVAVEGGRTMKALQGDLFMGQGGQGGLSGWGPRSSEPGADSVFFAATPPSCVADDAVVLGRRVGRIHGLRAEVSRRVLHLTLCGIGTLPGLSDAFLGAACEVAGRVAAWPFEMRLDRIRSYPVGRAKLPLVAFDSARAPKMELFRRILFKDLLLRGLVRPRKLPDAHMTLFYDRGVVPEESIDPISWMVREFVLIRSLNGRARHEVLGCWPLLG
jgi:2'-5' RNA ligase